MNSARQDALSAKRTMTSGMESSARAADPMQDAVYSRVLMAVMAGRRTMVVADHTGGNGAVTGRRMADYMNSSGGVALTATGYRGARLEDLLSEAAVGIGLKRSNDLEELALSLERALDAAGSGLLVIFDAHLLPAPVIGDLCELSGSDTESGLYMQVLLTGGPALDAQFEKPGLVNAARLVASSRWRIESDDRPAEKEDQASPPVAERQAPVTLAAPEREMRTARSPAPPKKEQSAFTRRRAERREGAEASEPVPEQRPLRKPRAVQAYDVQSGPRPENREPAKSSNRVYWILAIGILFAFAAGFVTNALWPFAPRSASELLKGDGLSALTANLPSAPSITTPSQPVERQEPAGSAPTPEVSPPAQPAPQTSGHPAGQPTAPPAASGPSGAALPPDWKQPPVERQPSAVTRGQSMQGSAPPAERPVVAAPTPLTPQPQQQAQVPPRQEQVPPPQPARVESSSDVCREGSGAAKPPQNSFAGIAEGFMTDLRNLGRCINSLAK